MKRSLHIGINNYPGTDNDLSGCINDANDWQQALDARGFKTTMMLDSMATKGNMRQAIIDIVSETGRDDIAVITFSGHGTWVPDEGGDEPDGRDEALCPYDIHMGEILTDDEIYAILSERERGARIIVISDSCHSGSVSKMTHEIPGTEDDLWKFQKVRFMPPEIYLKHDSVQMERARRVEKVMVSKNKIRAAALLLSGCRDMEYSYDAWFNGRANGAFTFVALHILKDLPLDAVYRTWYQKIREILPNVNYPQTPQISGSWQQRSKWIVFNE
ncbi:MAG: caspase family protein [Desulfobacteraceae bacterium]